MQVAIDVGEMGGDRQGAPGESDEDGGTTPSAGVEANGGATSPSRGSSFRGSGLRAHGRMRRDDSWNSVTSAGAHHQLPSLGAAAKAMARFSQVASTGSLAGLGYGRLDVTGSAYQRAPYIRWVGWRAVRGETGEKAWTGRFRVLFCFGCMRSEWWER
jgi:hypothetical protein